MTRRNAIKALKWFKEYNEEDYCGGDRIQDEHGDWYYRITEQDFEAFDMAAKALEQEPCKDCISREAVLNLFNKSDDYRWETTLIKKKIEKIPPVTPQELFINKPCVSSGVCEHDKQKVLEKIRAEIAKYGSIMVTYAITKDTKTDKGIEKLVRDVLKQAKEQVLEVIDKYKAKIDPQESEG